MHIVILGPGALGLLLACRLSRLHEEACTLWLLDHNLERADRLQERGILLEEGGATHIHPIRVTADTRTIPACDALLLCVKSNAVTKAMEDAAPLLRKGCLLVALQNGIAHLDLLPDKNTAAGVTSLGATLINEGQIRHGGDGPTYLGFPGKASPEMRNRLELLLNLLRQAGLEAESSNTIQERIWAKLFVNVGINALTALHDLPNGALLGSPSLREVMAEAIREAIEVADKLRIPVAGDPIRRTEEVCRNTAANISSTLQDIRRGRSTEIQAINGAIVRLGRKLGISTQVNQTLTDQILALEKPAT